MCVFLIFFVGFSYSCEYLIRVINNINNKKNIINIAKQITNYIVMAVIVMKKYFDITANIDMTFKFKKVISRRNILYIEMTIVIMFHILGLNERKF